MHVTSQVQPNSSSAHTSHTATPPANRKPRTNSYSDPQTIQRPKAQSNNSEYRIYNSKAVILVSAMPSLTNPFPLHTSPHIPTQTKPLSTHRNAAFNHHLTPFARKATSISAKHSKQPQCLRRTSLLSLASKTLHQTPSSRSSANRYSRPA